MKKNAFLSNSQKLVLLIFLASCANLSTFQNVECEHCDIWGEDDRSEAFQITDSNIRDASRATGIVVYPSAHPRVNNDNQMVFDFQQSFEKKAEQTRYGFCDEVRFTDQEMFLEACSGQLVAPDLFATAFHCVKPVITHQEDGTLGCTGLSVAFGYELAPDSSFPTTIPRGNFYDCKNVEIIEPDPEHHSDTSDFALIRLTEPVTGRVPSKIDFRKPQPGRELSIWGYPYGMPLKHSKALVEDSYYTDKFIKANARLGWYTDEEVSSAEEDFSKHIHFKSDIFNGNSGGPLVNPDNGAVYGVVRNASQKAKRVEATAPFEEFNTNYLWAHDSAHFDLDKTRQPACRQAIRCDDEDFLCDTHASAGLYSNYRKQLEALGIMGIDY